MEHVLNFEVMTSLFIDSQKIILSTMNRRNGMLIPSRRLFCLSFGNKPSILAPFLGS
jgi:hypothetical protein